MSFDDLWFGFFRGIVRGIGLGPLFLGAIILLAIGTTLAIRQRFKWLADGLLITSACAIWLGFLAISECQSEEKISEIIRSRTHTFSDYWRLAAQLGLLAVPGVIAIVIAVQRKMLRERRRLLLSTYLRIANWAYYEGDFDRAISEYSIAIKTDPKRIESYIKRGLAYRDKGMYDQAIADFNRTLVLDQDCAAGYLNRGKVRAAAGNHTAAIEDFDRAVDLDTGNADALLHRGLSLGKLGESVKAADDFRKVLRITNHSDFAEPAKFHLSLLEEDLTMTDPTITTW